MKILMLTQWFDPEPFFKGLTFARELVRLGHDVHVLTGFPNYPGGVVYKGYRIRPLQREQIDGVKVLRVALYPSHDTSSVRRIANYASFALCASTLGAALVERADVVYVYHPPATVGLAAMALKRLRRMPFVYDIQDLWPDALHASGLFNSKWGCGIVGKWCDSVYRSADRIVVLSPGFKRVLCERGVSESSVEVIYNWHEEDIPRSTGRDESLARELGLAGRFNIIFAGTMGKMQALEAVLYAARMVQANSTRVQFVFIGGGIEADRLRGLASELNLTNTLFLPRRPPSEIGPILSLADVLLIHLKDDPLFRITIPSKTQGYLCAGRPILAAVEGDTAELVQRAGAGVCCAPENPEQIAEAAMRLSQMPQSKLEDMGRSGRVFYNQELSLRTGVKKFELVFESVTTSCGAR